jgi:hypothetical protein
MTFRISYYKPFVSTKRAIVSTIQVESCIAFLRVILVRIHSYIPIYVQKMQLYTVCLYLETALHVSSGASTHHQERIQLYLQHLLFVTPLLLPAAIVEELDSTLKPVPTLPR